ncbi:MAG TPA: 3-dehydroquinate synthase family protein [Thermoanaerobaculia bacterium]|nr:3-dehydroquinate synthase family protein [Thermoanaerobaculia bacterium]
MIETFELRHARGTTWHAYGPGALRRGAEELAAALAGRAAFAVSSRPVLDLHGGSLRSAFEPVVGRLEVLEVSDGEAAKCVAGAETLWRRLSAAGGKRDSVLLAFGGGSVGDLTGFVAGSFLRGVEWIQLPTTLLAQVDAAVGGKTAIDLPEAKNAVGLFHHPRAVLAESAVLGTLGPEARRCGLVEAIKAAALLDLPLLERIEGSLDELLAGAPGPLGVVAAGAARAKAALVETDPEEAGPRMLLNLGHTIGHALEAEIGYGRIAHGDAVAHGLRFALRLSLERGAETGYVARLERLLDRLGTPPLPALDPERLVARLGRDKKARETGLAWVLVEGPGRGRVARDVPEPAIRAQLESWLDGRVRKSL